MAKSKKPAIDPAKEKTVKQLRQIIEKDPIFENPWDIRQTSSFFENIAREVLKSEGLPGEEAVVDEDVYVSFSERAGVANQIMISSELIGWYMDRVDQILEMERTDDDDTGFYAQKYDLETMMISALRMGISLARIVDKDSEILERLKQKKSRAAGIDRGGYESDEAFVDDGFKKLKGMVESGDYENELFDHIEYLLKLRKDIPPCCHYKVDKGWGFGVKEVEKRGRAQEIVIPVYEKIEGGKPNLRSMFVAWLEEIGREDLIRKN